MSKGTWPIRGGGLSKAMGFISTSQFSAQIQPKSDS